MTNCVRSYPINSEPLQIENTNIGADESDFEIELSSDEVVDEGFFVFTLL